jgi:hypothetical protein
VKIPTLQLEAILFSVVVIEENLLLNFESIQTTKSKELAPELIVLESDKWIIFTITLEACIMSKSYHTKATGAALQTVEKHSKDEAIKLYGSCFWYEILYQ